MDTRIKERCIYCGGDVYYHSGESLMKCDWCGQTIPVMKFQGEMTRMKKTEEENALIKEQLQEAEKEKQAADDRLFAALSNLGQIRDDQDTLGKTLSLLINGQEDSLSSLEYVKGISEKLVNSQNDIFAKMDVMQDIRTQLQNMDIAEQERQSFMNEFMLWSQQIRQDDVQRLQGISSSVDTLMEGQREISGKVDELKIAADQHRQTLEAFKAQYSRDKLEKVQKLYRQAEDYQHDRRYDKAEEYYRRMLTEGEEDAEVYWRLIMCHYCMFYEKDNDGRLIPIILNPDLTDPTEMSLRKELTSHMAGEESYYTARLQEIDRILDKYRLLKNQVKYDVFISVKQDENGHYTADSDVASDLYDFLKGQGLRVFNSRRTVIPSGQEYEPYIISALISSKVMIVVGTTPENMNANWVKNEWSRFQWLQFREKEKTGKTDRILFCYLAKGMRAEQIPRALHPNRQAIIDGVKAHDKLLASLLFVNKPDTSAVRSGYTTRSPQKTDYEQIQKKMTAWLVIGRYERVREQYEELLDEGVFLTYPSLHLAALCARQKVSDIDKIVNSEFNLEQAPEYIAAVRLCQNNEDKEMLKEMLDHNKEWQAKEKQEDIGLIKKAKEEDKPELERRTGSRHDFDDSVANKPEQKHKEKENKTTTKEKKSKLLKILAVVLVILAIIAGYAGNILSKSKSAADEYLVILDEQVDDVLTDSDNLRDYGLNQVDYKVYDMIKDGSGDTYKCKVDIIIDDADRFDEETRKDITEAFSQNIPRELVLPSGKKVVINTFAVSYIYN